MFPKCRGKLFEDEDLKTTENRRLGPKERQMHLGHLKCAYGMKINFMRLGNATRNSLCAPCISHAPRACKKSGRNCLFLLLFWVKLAPLTQTQVETLTINTSLRHSEFLVQNWSSSRGRQLWSFGRVSIFSLIF